MPLVTPTRSSYSWDTIHTASIDKIYEQIQDPHEILCPTARILFSNMKRESFGVDETFLQPIKTKDYSPSLATAKNQRFDADDIDNITMSSGSLSWYKSSAGTNNRDWAHYNTDNVRFNHINMKVSSMHKGFSQMLSHALWSNWNETIINSEIDISSALSNMELPPEDLKLKNVSGHSGRLISIPMAIRKTVLGHTFQGIATTTTTNAYWRCTVSDNPIATITRSPSGDNIDVVTSVTNPQPIDLDNVGEHLDKVQESNQFNLYAVCGRQIYRQLSNIVLASTRRDSDSPLADLGIKASITWDDYNTVFYQDPVMDALHPYSIFIYDPECLELVVDESFDPTSGTGIRVWEELPGTNQLVTWMMMGLQLRVTNRRGISAMHGWTKS